MFVPFSTLNLVLVESLARNFVAVEFQCLNLVPVVFFLRSSEKMAGDDFVAVRQDVLVVTTLNDGGNAAVKIITGEREKFFIWK